MTSTIKAKRVRTGCLTCRERHLKCDEAVPQCDNCRKGDRTCKRGVQLKFKPLDFRCAGTARFYGEGVKFEFDDESRAVASGYVGGLENYPSLGSLESFKDPKLEDHFTQAIKAMTRQDAGSSDGETNMTQSIRQRVVEGGQQSPHELFQRPLENPTDLKHRLYTQRDNLCPLITETSQFMAHASAAHASTCHVGPNHKLPNAMLTPPDSQSASEPLAGSIEIEMPGYLDMNAEYMFMHTQSWPIKSAPPSPSLTDRTPTPNKELTYLDQAEEVQYMKVFVETVVGWMESFDLERHFALLPIRAVRSPPVLNAALACGAMNASSKTPTLQIKAQDYYNSAKTQFVCHLHKLDCDFTELRELADCAAAAVILSLYEMMCAGSLCRIVSFVKARDLIQRGKWDAASEGLGGACFWLHVATEVFECLQTGNKISWDPSGWNVNMNFYREPWTERAGKGNDRDETWVHRIFFIMAKVSDFRAEHNTHRERKILDERQNEWRHLSRSCDIWNDACPPTMQPAGYVEPCQTRGKSCFPNVWMLRQSGILGRLFYHTAMCILAQTSPEGAMGGVGEVAERQLHHSRQICGIVAHSDDTHIAPVTTCLLNVARDALTDHDEISELIRLLNRARK